MTNGTGRSDNTTVRPGEYDLVDLSGKVTLTDRTQVRWGVKRLSRKSSQAIMWVLEGEHKGQCILPEFHS